MTKINLINKNEIKYIFSNAKNSTPSVSHYNPKFRDKAIALGFPPYALSTEINAIMHYMPTPHGRTLVSTLWNTGADINEITRLKRNSFILKSLYPHVKFVTNRDHDLYINHDYNIYRTRTIPLISYHYVKQIKQLIGMLNIHNYTRDTWNVSDRIWSVDELSAESWITNAVNAVKDDGISFPVAINSCSIRSSFTMNMLALDISPSIVMNLMGFNDPRCLDTYINIKKLMST